MRSDEEMADGSSDLNLSVRVRKFSRAKNIYLPKNAMIEHKKPFADIGSKIDSALSKVNRSNKNLEPRVKTTMKFVVNKIN